MQSEIREDHRFPVMQLGGQYVKAEEMLSVREIADAVFIPTPLSGLPAVAVELKRRNGIKRPPGPFVRI